MSALNKKTINSIAEPEQFFTGEQEEVEEYQPQHPAIAFIKQATMESKKEDHFDEYVEVNPFVKK